MSLFILSWISFISSSTIIHSFQDLSAAYQSACKSQLVQVDSTGVAKSIDSFKRDIIDFNLESLVLLGPAMMHTCSGIPRSFEKLRPHVSKFMLSLPLPEDDPGKYSDISLDTFFTDSPNISGMKFLFAASLLSKPYNLYLIGLYYDWVKKSFYLNEAVRSGFNREIRLIFTTFDRFDLISVSMTHNFFGNLELAIDRSNSKDFFKQAVSVSLQISENPSFMSPDIHDRMIMRDGSVAKTPFVYDENLTGDNYTGDTTTDEPEVQELFASPARTKRKRAELGDASRSKRSRLISLMSPQSPPVDVSFKSFKLLLVNDGKLNFEKIQTISDFMKNEKIQISVVSESMLSSRSSQNTRNFSVNFPVGSTQKEGIGFMVDRNLDASEISLGKNISLIDLSESLGIRIIGYYQPPSVNYLLYFIRNWPRILANMTNAQSPLIIAGDFNARSGTDARQLIDYLFMNYGGLKLLSQNMVTYKRNKIPSDLDLIYGSEEIEIFDISTNPSKSKNDHERLIADIIVAKSSPTHQVQAISYIQETAELMEIIQKIINQSSIKILGCHSTFHDDREFAVTAQSMYNEVGVRIDLTDLSEYSSLHKEIQANHPKLLSPLPQIVRDPAHKKLCKCAELALLLQGINPESTLADLNYGVYLFPEGQNLVSFRVESIIRQLPHKLFPIQLISANQSLRLTLNGERLEESNILFLPGQAELRNNGKLSSLITGVDLLKLWVDADGDLKRFESKTKEMLLLLKISSVPVKPHRFLKSWNVITGLIFDLDQIPSTFESLCLNGWKNHIIYYVYSLYRNNLDEIFQTEYQKIFGSENQCSDGLRRVVQKGRQAMKGMLIGRLPNNWPLNSS
jgi:hypothetical protein